jgi:transcription antitermination factor NusB
MSGPVRRRTRARESALQYLYMMEVRGHEAEEELDAFVEHQTKASRDPRGRGEIATFTKQLCQGIPENRLELDQWIEAIARNWRLDRMALVDRNVLRLALYELIFHPDTPYKVVINEAIEIAKRFSTAQSGSFVNGILDRARILIEDARAASDGHPVPPKTAAPAPKPEPRPHQEVAPDTLFSPPVPRPRRREDS